MKISNFRDFLLFKLLAGIIILSFCFLFQNPALASLSSEIKSRDKIDDVYKWKPEDIYPSLAAWKSDRDKVIQKIKKASLFKGKVVKSAEQLYGALSYIFDLYRKLEKLYVYAEMLSDQDIRQSEPLSMLQLMKQMYTELNSEISYLDPEILSISLSKLRAFYVSEPRLKMYKRYIGNIQRMKQHTLGDKEENIIAKAGSIVGIASSAHNVFSNAEIPFPKVRFSDGSESIINVPGYSRWRASSNRDDRIKAYKTFYSTLGKYRGTLGVLLNGKIKENLFYKDIRKFDSSLESILYPKKIPTSVYTGLIQAVHKALPTLHRYLKLRKKMMGLDKLFYHDLYPDLVKGVDTRYKYEEACKLIQKSLNVLGSEYVSKLREAFNNRWIDVFPSIGKASGAYSTGAYDTHPYIKLNYNGKFNDVSMLAHELGHSIHSYFSNKNQPYPTANYASFIAEVAATVNEALVADYVLKTSNSRETRIAILGSFLETCRMTLYRQTLFAEFELVINQLGEKGESLTGDRFDQIYLDLLKKYYGHNEGITVIDKLYSHEWGYISHFFLGFYNYLYSTSFAAAHAIAEKIETEGEPMVKRYIAFLSSGSSIDSIPLLKKLGVDMTTDDPINMVVKKMEGALDEIEKLIK